MKPDMRELDKLVEKVLPEDLNWDTEGLWAWKTCKENLTKALSSGLLCEPMTVEELGQFIFEQQKFQYADPKEDAMELAKAIHEAQMRRKV